MKQIRSILLVPLGVALAAACDGSPTQPPQTPRLEVVSGSAQTDTSGAILSQPLVVRVVGGNGKGVAGQAVRFSVPRDTFSFPGSNVRILVSQVTFVRPATPGGYDSTATELSDADGTVQVQVRMGIYAKDVTVTASAPGFANASTVYHIHPGNPVRLRVLPGDSALYAGASYTLRARTEDQWGNPRADPVQLSLADAGTVQLNGSVLQGQQLGRAMVRGQAGTFTDSAFVSVVPRGSIVAIREHRVTSDSAMIEYFGLDGSAYRRVKGNLWDSGVAWVPGTNGSVVVESRDLGGSNFYHLAIVDSLGGRRGLVPASLGLTQELQPQAGLDGWIYFAGDPPVGQDYLELWRIRPDGSGAQRIGGPAGYYDGDRWPSPSPDGQRVVYTSSRGDCCNRFFLHVRDIATGDTTNLGFVATTPRWSPADPDQIAYGVEAPADANIFAMEIHVMRPDGTGDRRVSPAGRAYRPEFTWSPDGKWILAQTFVHDHTGEILELIEVATGRTLPLGFTQGLISPSWR